MLGAALLTVIILWLICCWCLLKHFQQRKRELTALHSKINDIEKNVVFLDDVIYHQNHIKKDDTNLKPEFIHSSDSAYIDLDDYHAGLMELEKFMLADEIHTSVTIRDVKANVYGRGVRASQMYSMVQDYFEKSKSVNPIHGTPLEKIIIEESRVEPKHKETSRLRPTSVFEPELTGASVQSEHVERHQFAHGMFVHDDVDDQGGTIQVSGITMEIPKGALKERTTITVGIAWDKEKRPVLLSKQALISPIVVCEPTGLLFLIPVKITMSHCAVNVKQKWKTTLMKCEGKLSQTSYWSNADEFEGEQMVVDEHEVTFRVKHFTQYALIGESKGDQPCAKSVNLVTFTSLLRVGDFFKVRIYCVDSYKDEQHQNQIEVRMSTYVILHVSMCMLATHIPLSSM